MIMNKQFNIIIAILSLNMLMLLQLSSFSQEQKTIVVLDEDGNPVSGAIVTVEERAKPLITDENGEFNIASDANLNVYIEAEGFEPVMVESRGLNSVNLYKAPFHLGKRDEVNVPFGILKKREIAGAVTVLDPKELLKYDQGKSIREAINGRVPGFFGSSDLRGMGSPLYVINGVPREGIDINLQEIDQITVLKDLSSVMLYGSQATNGVVLITTRRGVPLKNELNFTAESGLNFPINYPSYLSAPDYMDLYNEALANDGIDARYSSDEISSTRLGENTVRFPDVDYYNSTYLKDWSSYSNVVGEITSGNKIGQFYLSLGWKSSKGLLAIGEGANERTDRLNFRSNIDYKVAEKIDLVFDGAVIFNFSKGPRYSSGDDFWGLSSTLKPNIYQPLIPSELLNIQPELLGAAKLIDDKYVLGGTSEYRTNIYGELTRNGVSNSNNRLIEINTGLDFDLSGITDGLSAIAYVSFDMYSWFAESLEDRYAIYRPNFTEDNNIESFSKIGEDEKVHEKTIDDVTFYRRYGTYGKLDYQKVLGDHKIDATAMTYLYRYDEENIHQPEKNFHFGLRINHLYRNKFITELTGVYAGTVKLYSANNQFAFSPGIGLGWIVTEESFFRDNSVIDYLKIRTNLAINHTDKNIQNYWHGSDYYITSGSYPFNHGGYSNVGVRFYPGNKDLQMEKIMNANFGFEAMLMNYQLGIEGSYFYNKNYDLVTLRTNLLPNYFGSLPYENYGSYQRQGIEAGVNYTTHMGDVKLQVGTNLTYSVSELLKWDELAYEDEYRKNIGKSVDAMFSYVALGFFNDEDDITGHPTQTFGDVQPGDIKYDDLNNDGVIDSNDQMNVGNSKPTLQYGLNMKLTYKALDFFVLSSGQSGQDRYFNNAYYWVYGDRKYSDEVLNRWTTSTASTADYPRLSSTFNANNFRNSTFWLYKSNWFRIQTVQMTYTVPGGNIAGLDKVSFFIRGNNLLTVSKIKDKLELNVGSAPQMRVFSLGLKLMF